jgi:amyloid beta precursor protein binding protein 1
VLRVGCSSADVKVRSDRLIMRALKRFVESEGAAGGLDGSIASLPLSGNLPDMHADTKSYIELQNIYREQAARDCSAVGVHVQVMMLAPV